MIRVFDNFLQDYQREELYMMSVSAKYQIGWDDSSTIEYRQYPCFFKELTKKEWEELNFMENIINVPEELNGLVFEKAVINLVTPSAIHFAHTHPNKTVLCYYFNNDWRDEWYGETIFYNQQKSDATNVVMYKPNRAVLFSGETPHSIRPASFIAPQYRFTLSVFFRQSNFIEESKNNS